MITKYFSKVVVKFNPVGKENKVARVFLSSIPPKMRGACKITNQLIYGESAVKPVIQVTFKDKHFIEADPTKLNILELSNLLDGHSRKLAMKESTES